MNTDKNGVDTLDAAETRVYCHKKEKPAERELLTAGVSLVTEITGTQ